MSSESENRPALSPNTWMGKLDEALAQKNFLTEGLDRIEQKTNVKKRYIALDEGRLKTIFLKAVDSIKRIDFYELMKTPRILYAILTFIAIYLVIGYGASLLCNLIGFVYPAYISVKAIESKEKDDDTEWLMYWVVFATFSVFEFFSDIFLSWFPFYFLAKCIFLLWCMAPISYNGSKVIYYRFIQPFILKNESTIDSALDAVNLKGTKFAESAVKEAKEIAASAAADMVSQRLKDD